MQLFCPNCKAPIPSLDINIGQMVAKCHKCDQVFAFEHELVHAERHRPEILLPPGIEAYSLLNEMNFEVSWRNGKELGFFLFFTIFWDSIVFLFAVLAILSGELTMLLFLSLHIAVGIGLLYYTVCLLLNKTYIQVNRRTISLEHKPLPMLFYPNQIVEAKAIDQLFIERYSSSKTNGRPNYAFSVEAIMKDGSRKKLLKGLKSEEQAGYIEQQIEHFLQIKDRKVEEEWRG